MGRQRHAWSDNETERKIQNNLDKLEEEFGEKWQKEVWKLGVDEAINQLPSLKQRLERVRNQKDKIEEKEKKLIAKKRKQNIKSEEQTLESEIRQLEGKIKEWKDKEPKSREDLEEKKWKAYQNSPAGKKSDSKSREDFLSQERIQNKIERDLEKCPSREEIRSKVASFQKKLEEKKSELEELEVNTYAPY